MKTYIGTKIIQAEPMSRGDYNTYRGWTIPADENPADEGYLVKYPDNYESWSPKKQFEEAYRAFDGGMPFGSALELLKQGFKVTRKGWNGKDQFLYLVEGNTLEYTTSADMSCLLDKEIPHSDVIAIRTTSGVIQVGWLASQTDMLSEDWVVVD